MNSLQILLLTLLAALTASGPVREIKGKPVKPDEPELNVLFKLFDDNGDGSVTIDEFEDMLSHYGETKFSDAEMRRRLALMDTDESGGIELREFDNYLEANCTETEDVKI